MNNHGQLLKYSFSSFLQRYMHQVTMHYRAPPPFPSTVASEFLYTTSYYSILIVFTLWVKKQPTKKFLTLYKCYLKFQLYISSQVRAVQY